MNDEFYTIVSELMNRYDIDYADALRAAENVLNRGMCYDDAVESVL